MCLKKAGKNLCQCVDRGCPHCKGGCPDKATVIVYRSDMDDANGTPMCDDCANDAIDSGVFTDATDDYE